MKVTLREVARKAKVSTATVSRVLNDIGPIKNSTRKRVMQAVAELKYRPNIHARALAAGKSQTLGMIVSNLTNPFFLDIFSGLERGAREKGYQVVVASTDYDGESLVSNVHSMISRRVAGLALVVSEMEPALIADLADSDVPTAYYDVGVAGPNSTNIRVNYHAGMQTMLEYLHDLGHRRMAFVGHHTSLGPLQEREHSFVSTIQSEFKDVQFVKAAQQDSPFGGQAAAAEVLDSGFAPTAIVCVNDYMAMGVLGELRERGVRVPEDVSVTGFDNIGLAQFVSPPLTTVNIPRDEIAQMFLKALLPEEKKSALMGREVQVKPDLIIRQTTGRASTARSVAAHRP